MKLAISLGRDEAGRTVIPFAIEPPDFERLMAHAADAAECEDCGDDNEPYQCLPRSPTWCWRAERAFTGLPHLM